MVVVMYLRFLLNFFTPKTFEALRKLCQRRGIIEYMTGEEK